MKIQHPISLIVIFCSIFSKSFTLCPNNLMYRATWKQNSFYSFEKNVSRIKCEDSMVFEHVSIMENLNRICADLIHCRVDNFNAISVKLQEIEPFSFRNANVLRVITVCNNNISTIKSLTFVNMSLVLIDLSRNKIRAIEKNAFFNVSVVKKFDFSANLLYTICGDEFSYMRGFYFDFSYNQFRKITKNTLKMFENSSEAVNFDFYQNKIEEIEEDAFFYLRNKSIRKIDFAYNNISFLREGLFNELIDFNSATIDLNQNPLREIPASLYKKKLAFLNCYKSYLNESELRVMMKWAQHNNYVLLCNSLKLPNQKNSIKSLRSSWIWIPIILFLFFK